jgi:hypothetical protein
MIGFPDHEVREKFTTTAARQGVEVSAGAHPATREEAHRVAVVALQGARFILREWRDVGKGGPGGEFGTHGGSWKQEFAHGNASARWWE